MQKQHLSSGGSYYQNWVLGFILLGCGHPQVQAVPAVRSGRNSEESKVVELMRQSGGTEVVLCNAVLGQSIAFLFRLEKKETTISCFFLRED